LLYNEKKESIDIVSGVGLLLLEEARRSLMTFEAIRKVKNISLIQCCTPIKSG
jgi:hypothetical protein